MAAQIQKWYAWTSFVAADGERLHMGGPFHIEAATRAEARAKAIAASRAAVAADSGWSQEELTDYRVDRLELRDPNDPVELH